MRQAFVAPDIAEFPPASHSAVANTVTRTNLWVPALWTPIGALDPKPGKAYHLRVGGIISTTGTPTIIFNPTFGQSTTPGSNIALGASTTWTLGTLTNAPWWAEFVLGFRQLGIAAAGSTITGNGFVVVGGAAGAVGQCIPIGGLTGLTTADHTTPQGLVLDVTWGTASASNTITAQWTMLQSLN
jgi:hypothetical protein